MSSRKLKPIEGDDGRVIANMNVEGMPWYTPGKKNPAENGEAPEAKPQPVMTKQEARYYTWGALKAALLVTLVMCGGIALFVLFCLKVWF